MNESVETDEELDARYMELLISHHKSAQTRYEWAIADFAQATEIIKTTKKVTANDVLLRAIFSMLDCLHFELQLINLEQNRQKDLDNRCVRSQGG